MVGARTLGDGPRLFAVRRASELVDDQEWPPDFGSSLPFLSLSLTPASTSGKIASWFMEQ